VATVQNAAKTGARSAGLAGSAESAAATPYTALPLGPSSRDSSYEADLSAEEAQASTDPRFPCAQPHALRARDPEAPASKGPQAPHPVALASEGRPDARRRRLSRSGDFDRVYREGSSRGNRFLVLYSFARGDQERGDASRLGLSVGRKIGKAVTRNKVKRAIREAFWELSEHLTAGHDYVVVARPGVEGLLEREGREGVGSSLAELLVDTQGEPEGEERLS
jgi:ribonuclease P protein component